MGLILGVPTSTVGFANKVFLNAFTPRTNALSFSHATQFTPSVRTVEPVSMMSTFARLSQWRGSTPVVNPQGYTCYIPNNIHNVSSSLSRADYESDQIGAFPNLISQAGLNLLKYLDQYFFNRLIQHAGLRGATTNTANQVQLTTGQDPTLYSTTFDNVPMFSTKHAYTGSASSIPNQSNYIVGSLPSTIAGVQSQSVETTTQNFLQDIQQIFHTFASFIMPNGDNFWNSFDGRTTLTIYVPMILYQAAKIAFGTNLNNIVSATTNVGSDLIARVVPNNYMYQVPDMNDSTPGAFIKGLADTMYICVLSNDYVRPFLGTAFQTMPNAWQYPFGSQSPQDKMAADFKAAKQILNVDDFTAAVYSATIVDTNLNAQGNQAQPSTMNGSFFVAPRFRGAIEPAFWPCSLCVLPSGSTVPSW